ncbi:uncharacterized protein LTR77_001726 [Saxophila tyrrhenica]|uniref:Uncharacterized protein n=1 Tax=Saxophila tyrrhenica TaxID=1690608 RepID=A0AAV9PMB9_9PEZI|nr:hypothetical protein LTR77_001726 [Saxophila tyrrhenica]
MSFFNQQEYLQNTKTRKNNNAQGEMQVKDSAPLFATSPERRHALRKLADIPEATPGPNAFAQQEAHLHRYRLDSNAFYQQEMQRRLATPPTIPHPALRQRSASDPPTPPRMSTCTTMSPFIDAGKPEKSPPLKLVPSDDYLAEPTERGYIEERREQILHEKSGNEGQRTPVFVSTSTFSKSVGTPRERTEKKKEVTIAEPPVNSAKTPKRSILEKLRLNTNFRNTPSSIPTATYAVPAATEAKDHVPVKAQAILGTTSPSKKSRTSFGSSPSKSNIPRSPSKRKGLFSRKTSGLGESVTSRSKSALSSRSVESDHPPPTASTAGKTPPTAFSDPTHYSYSGKSTRIASQPHSSTGLGINKCSIARSQSLKYFDTGIPPTPPSKDTPPEEKAKREPQLKSKSSRLPFHDEQVTTPSKEQLGFVSTNERLSPTKFGSYGNREVPKLVTMPSMYSLHASVVPTLHDASTFEEMKARMDGLALEGFSLPPENMRGPKQGIVYSPSIYSTEWGERPNSVLIHAASPSHQAAARHTKKYSDKSKSSSSGGDIPIVYPELAKDPSYSDITPGALHAKKGRGREQSEATLPVHGCTHSRDHSCDSRASRESAIFAHGVEEDADKHSPTYGSPSSFSHASAAPSPLHILPATTYSPPPRKNSKAHLLTPEPANRSLNGKDGLHISTPGSRNNLFTNAPTLPASSPTRPPSPLRHTESPAAGLRNSYTGADTNVDPEKPSPPKKEKKKDEEPTDKIDKMLELLANLNTRNNEIINIRDEMRASNMRLGERLAVVEKERVGSPVSSLGGSEGSGPGFGVRNEKVREGKRVSTAVAEEFYRGGIVQEQEESEDGESEGDEGEGRKRADTIAELRETNERLLEMVSGFAERIKSLEGRKGRS